VAELSMVMVLVVDVIDVRGVFRVAGEMAIGETD
jgi:hypothetical protein